MRANIVRDWQRGHKGRWRVMRLALDWRERNTLSHRWMPTWTVMEL
jgi:hypothetical protein